jgi:uncharacterized protein (DUF2384 family)
MARQDQAKKASKEPAVMVAGAGSRAVDVVDFGDPTQSEEAGIQSQDEVAMVRRATEVLGVNHVGRWMRSQIPSLGNQTPYALIQTEHGRKQVERVLLKIEHGVY